MQAFINGEFVAEEQARVSVFDRAFLYGDGLFETMYFAKGALFRADAHLARLAAGAEFLKIALPFSLEDIKAFLARLISQPGLATGLVRLTLSRGVGIRGYSPRGAERPMLVMTVHPASSAARPQSWRLITASFRLPAGDPLAQFKTCNKLAQVMARAEADAAGADEALLLNTDGDIVEASSSNLFWLEDDVVCTAPVASGVLPGVTRSVVMELCAARGIKTVEKAVKREQVLRSAGAFLSLSSFGVVPAESLDGVPLARNFLAGELAKDYWRQVLGS